MNVPAKRATELVRRGTELATDVSKKAGTALLEGVDVAIQTRWPAAQERAARLTGNTIDEKVKALAEVYAIELGTVGAVAGGAAAVPAVGTGASIIVSLSELGYFSARTAELVLTVGALHGHSDATVEEQRAWILAVLAFGGSASKGFAKFAGEAGRGLGAKAVARIPAEKLAMVNKALGRTIITKYGTKRGVVALGTALPFGIGAAVGGGLNYGMTRAVAKHADRFFRDLPYIRATAPAINPA